MESKKFINANDLKCSVLNTGLQGRIIMKYFQTISKGSKKVWKENKKMKCAFCGKEIDPKEDHFTLTLFWKIKNKEDVKYFCSLECLKKWIEHVSRG